VCGRFTLTVQQLGDIVELLGAEIDPPLADRYSARYNIAPGDQHWILRSKAGRREIVAANWGLVNHWSKDRSAAFRQINARAETLSVRPAYREAFRSRRCVLPADGFYEWRGPKGAREPLWFHRSDGGLMLFAGLYEGWIDPTTGEVSDTFTIITTEANEVVKPIHDRMPAIIAAEAIDDWVAGDAPERLLAAPPVTGLAVRPASPRVNDANNDDPNCLSADDPLAHTQLSLFS